jgi:hypothetical protein
MRARRRVTVTETVHTRQERAVPAVVDIYRAQSRRCERRASAPVRPAAIEEFRDARPELLRAELIRLDHDTWLDVLV